MAYCTQADIEEQISAQELTELTDDQDLGEVDQGVLARAIADADAQVDALCGLRFPVPFSPVPVLVRKASVDLALYHLHARRGGAASAERLRRYQAALDLLEKAAQGLASLGGDSPAPVPDSGPGATTDPGDRVFTLARASANTTGSLDDY